jgi:hypothetical protein
MFQNATRNKACYWTVQEGSLDEGKSKNQAIFGAFGCKRAYGWRWLGLERPSLVSPSRPCENNDRLGAHPPILHRNFHQSAQKLQIHTFAVCWCEYPPIVDSKCAENQTSSLIRVIDYHYTLLSGISSC